MFFTSKVTIPLETLSDVLEAYPSWRLKILDGLQIYFLGSNVPQVFKIGIMLAERHSNLYIYLPREKKNYTQNSLRGLQTILMKHQFHQWKKDLNS